MRSDDIRPYGFWAFDILQGRVSPSRGRTVWIYYAGG